MISIRRPTIFVMLAGLQFLAPAAQASAPNCLAAVAPAQSRPVTRFETRLLLVSQAVPANGSHADLIQSLASEQVRRALLELQALAKLYEATDASKPDLKRIVDFRTEVKGVEGALGSFMREVELLERTRDGGGSPVLLEAIAKELKGKKKELVTYLKNTNWLPDPARETQSLERSLEEFDFKRGPKDQKRLLKALITKVDGAREELKGLDRYFASDRFTEADLENGTHHLRRALRWVATMIQSTDGVFVYGSAHAKTSQDAELVNRYISSKYVKLAPGGRIKIDPMPMVQLSRLVSELGELKDYKESQLDLARVMVEMGFETTPLKAEAAAGRIMTAKFGVTQVEPTARELYAFYKQTDPLKALSQQLRQRLSELQ